MKKTIKQVFAESWEKTKQGPAKAPRLNPYPKMSDAPAPTMLRTADGPRCPYCKSARLHARRSTTRRVVIGVGGVVSVPLSAGVGTAVVAVAAKKNRVKCEVCNKTFRLS